MSMLILITISHQALVQHPSAYLISFSLLAAGGRLLAPCTQGVASQARAEQEEIFISMHTSVHRDRGFCCVASPSFCITVQTPVL